MTNKKEWRTQNAPRTSSQVARSLEKTMLHRRGEGQKVDEDVAKREGARWIRGIRPRLDKHMIR
jgi:hypothetical protein